MLVLQEVNRVKGSAADSFETLTRQWWEEVEPLGVTPGWYFEVSHGTGPSYRVVTGVGIPDWDAWESLSRAIAYGALAATTEQLDATRYDSESTLFELVSPEAIERLGAPRPLGSPGAPAEGSEPETDLWVQRVLRSAAVLDDLPSESGRPGDRPQIVLRAWAGSSSDRLVVLSKEAPRAVLGLLTDRRESAAGGPINPAPVESTWVLRPAPWSPLR